jgi:glycosyltransferase involved in cell wall biosynthesis
VKTESAAARRGRPAGTPWKTRILHVITSLGKGGAETMLYNLLAHWGRDDFEHFVVSLTGEGYFGPKIRDLGVSVTAPRLARPAAAPDALAKAIVACRRFRPDIVQGWMYHGNVAAWLLRACARVGGRLFWNVRHSLHFFGEESFMTRNVIRLNRSLSRAADCCIFNSGVSLRQHASFGFTARDMVTIPNGFDTARFRPDPVARAAVRRRFGLAPDELVVGLVGRYHPLKDYGNYLKAAALLADGARPLRFVSVLVGRGLDSENPALRESLDAIPHAHRVIPIAESEDVPSLMNAFDVFCLPSRSEAFPNVVGEAMATGLPCVVTDVGDAASLVDAAGTVVPPKNPVSLAAGLRALLEGGAPERAALGRAARRRIESQYSIQSIAARYERLYAEAAGRIA